jgi:hypothetical protein
VAAPAFGSIGTNLFGTASTFNVAVPASVASGDIIIVSIFISSATTTVTGLPTGFAHVQGSPQTASGTLLGMATMWKRATGADSGTYNFTLSASDYRAGAAIRYTGCVAAGNPWDAPTGVAVDAANGTVTPSVNVDTAGPDRMLVFFGANWSGGAWTPPTGFTERLDINDRVNTVADKVQAVQGNSGGVTATCVGNDKRIALLGALIGTTAAAGFVAPTIVVPTVAAHRAASW